MIREISLKFFGDENLEFWIVSFFSLALIWMYDEMGRKLGEFDSRGIEAFYKNCNEKIYEDGNAKMYSVKE